MNELGFVLVACVAIGVMAFVTVKAVFRWG